MGDRGMGDRGMGDRGMLPGTIIYTSLFLLVLVLVMKKCNGDSRVNVYACEASQISSVKCELS